MGLEIQIIEYKIMTTKNKIFFISGGTGSFGRHFIKKILQSYNPKKVIIYSRDELKQSEMQYDLKKYKNKLRFFIGDIRDNERLDNAFRGNKIDIVIHAAALKQVPTSEYNPFETIKTNILGGQNIINSCIKHKVNKVIALSTDKAASPINLYGATKLASDKLFVSSNNYANPKTKLSVVRYGNVMGSRGSVIPYFLKNNPKSFYNITDPEMTRFNITLNEGVSFVLKCLDLMWGGEIFVPKIPSYKILDVLKAINSKARIKIIGIRPGEKLHEEMITTSDSLNTVEAKDFYAILPNSDYLDWNLNTYIIKNKKFKWKKCKRFFSYNSLENKHYLKINDIKLLLKKL